MSFMDTINSNNTKKEKVSNSTTSQSQSTSLRGGRYGWICPLCGRANSPDNAYCNCRGWTYPVWPSYPWWSQPWYCTTTASSSTTLRTDGTISTAKNTNIPNSYSTAASTSGAADGITIKMSNTNNDIAYINEV